MSVSVSVFLKAARLPTPVDWQAAIRAAGFEVELDTDFEPRTFSGFLPATYRGRSAGFEYSLDPITTGAADLGSERRIAAAAGHDRCITLVTHSNMAEAISAAVAAGALAALADGVLFDDESDEAHPASAATAWARSAEAEALPYLDAP